jgi:solute carrier family 35 protein E1
MVSASPEDSNPNATFKFPAFQPDLLPTHEEEPFGLSSSRTPSPARKQRSNSNAPSDRWQPRKDQRNGYLSASAHPPPTTIKNAHGRQKSLSEAFRTIRTRKASVSQNVHEVADALKVPLSPRLIVRRESLLYKGCELTDLDALRYMVHGLYLHKHLL